VTRGCLVWITGLPSAGKSTLAKLVSERLRAIGTACCLLDGDGVRAALAPALDYDERGRDRFYESLANLGVLLAGQGLAVIVAATASRRSYRERARRNADRYLEVWVDVPLEECRRRDSKGLYAAFAAGKARDVPGEDAIYEPPPAPDVVARGGNDDAALAALVRLLSAQSRHG
jgi:adenylylsulfate kinase